MGMLIVAQPLLLNLFTVCNILITMCLSVYLGLLEILYTFFVNVPYGESFKLLYSKTTTNKHV